MLNKDIVIGGTYMAKVSGKLVMVRVSSIDKRTRFGKSATVFTCKNLATGRTVTFHSAQKFRGAVTDQPKLPAVKAKAKTKQLPIDFDPPKAKPKTLKDRLMTNVAKAQHLVVEALAGTGKTFTMIVGVVEALAPSLHDSFIERMRQITGNDSLEIVPSEQQRAVWDHMASYDSDVTSVVYCAFNRSIVGEFAEKWGWVSDLLTTVGITLKFSTVNSLGNQCISRTFGRLNVTDRHTQNLLCDYLRVDIWELRKQDPILVAATERLVSLCKLTLAGWEAGKPFDPYHVTEDVLDELAAHFDIDMNGQREKVFKLVPEMLRMAMDVESRREIDFDDQNWLPVVLNLPIPRCDLIAVDEGQDLPRCKQEFVRRAGRHVIVVGDANQAIYGFAGADVESIPRMRRLLDAETLYLTETRRCGKAIVAEANKALATACQLRNEKPVTFVAHELNSAGTVSETTKVKYTKLVEDGDMVLSRVNAPLVSQALQFIKDGRKAIIRGREFGTELINFVKRMKAADIPDLIQKTDDWYHKECQKESKKANPSEAKLIALDDRRSCMEALCDHANSVDEVIGKIETIFAGKVCPYCGRQYSENVERCGNDRCKTEKDPITGYPCGPRLVTPKGILFSSVHRAKGLESSRVFVLRCDGSMFPHPMAKSDWQRQQEWNLKYVAVTRAINELIYVDGK